MIRATAICLMAVCAGSPAIADTACRLEHVSVPFDVFDDGGGWKGTHDFEMVLSRSDCGVRRFVTPQFACDLSIGTSHGSRGFHCGRALVGLWRVRNASDQRSYFDTLGDGSHAIAPSTRELKKAYEHLDDDDSAKPIYREDFPASFTRIGPRMVVPNPDVQASLQSLKYRTMTGEDRLAYSADAVVGCVKYQFGVILRIQEHGLTDALAHDTERDLSTFLGDIRLETVEDPVGTLRALHTPFTKEALLAPILACYRQRDGESVSP